MRKHVHNNGVRVTTRVYGILTFCVFRSLLVNIEMINDYLSPYCTNHLAIVISSRGDT